MNFNKIFFYCKLHIASGQKTCLLLFHVFQQWENEINLKRLKTKVLSLAYSLEDNYVDDSREILDEILKDDDSEVPSDDDEVVQCVKTEKENLMYEEIKNL